MNNLFDTINWSAGNKFLNVQIDTGTDLVDMGTQQLLSPYTPSTSLLRVVSRTRGYPSIQTMQLQLPVDYPQEICTAQEPVYRWLCTDYHSVCNCAMPYDEITALGKEFLAGLGRTLEHLQ